MKKQILMIATVALTAMFIIGGVAFAGEGCSVSSAKACTGAKTIDAKLTSATTAAEGTTVILAVDKMTCGSCVKHVTQTLTGIDGVQKVDVSLEKGTATVTYDKNKKVDESMLVAAVVKAGYPTTLAPATTAAAKSGDMKNCDPSNCDPAACGMTGAKATACTGKK